MKKTMLAGAILSSALTFSPAFAANYQIDTQGAHAAINFKVSHLGTSWLTGRFNTFDGQFSFDQNKPAATQLTVIIDTTSVDSNHAERDKHLRSGDFLNVSKFSTATFRSTSVAAVGDNKFKMTGTLSLQGIDKEIVIDAVKVGEGEDPWGGYRLGFAGSTSISMKDFGFKMDFGTIQFDLHIEGIRQ